MGGAVEEAGAGVKREEKQGKERGRRREEWRGRWEERGGKIQILAPVLCRHEGQCLGSQWPAGLAGGSSYGRRQAGLC